MKKKERPNYVEDFIEKLPIEKQEMLPLSIWTLQRADSQPAPKTATSEFYRNESLYCQVFYKPISRYTKYTL